MPYFITDEAPDCSGWATIKDDGEVIGCHMTKQDAVDQMIAVSLAEDMEPGGERKKHKMKKTKPVLMGYRELPDNYRPALADDVPEGRACGNCYFYDESRVNAAGDKAWCEKWDEFVDGAYYCNAWQANEERALPNQLEVGDFVSWNSSGGRARGAIVRIQTSGSLNVPDTDFSISASEDDPAALIRIYQKVEGGWSATETLVGHKFSTLTKIADLEEPDDSDERAINQDAPAYMRAAARRGLEYYADGKGGDGLVDKTIRDARLMASGQVSDDKWVRTAAWIARHLGDLDSADADPNSENYPSAGVVAHLLWGSGPSKSKAMAAMEYAQRVAERVKNDESRHLPGKHDQKSHSSGKSSSPEATAEAEKLQSKAIAAEPAITVKMQAVSADAGGELIGLEYKIKQTKSMAEKIDTKAKEEFNGDVKLAAADIGDSVRYTMALSESRYAAGTKETIDNLAAEGYTLKVKNYWQEGNIYKGVNVTAVTPDGQKFELQFHTKSSFKLKETTNHKLYEEHRKPRTSKKRKSVLEREMASNWDSVRNPTDSSALKLIGSPVLQPAS